MWCRRQLDEEGHTGIRSYGDLGQHAYGDIGRAAVEILVLLSQGGCGVSYLLFIAQNIASIFPRVGDAALFVYLLAPFQVRSLSTPSLSNVSMLSRNSRGYGI